MRCPECGEDNRDGALICGLCKALFGRPAREPAAQRAPRSDARVSAPAPAQQSGAAVWWVVTVSAAVVVAGGVIYKRHKQGRRYAVAATAPAPVPSPSGSGGSGTTPSAAAMAAKARPAATLAAAVSAPPATRASQPAVPAAVAIVEEAPALPPPRLSVSSSWYEGSDGHRRALDEQGRARAPMLVYFRVDWCPYCQRMDREVLPAPAVNRFLADVVKVRVNPETSPQDMALAKKYGVTGYPSVLVIPAPGATPESVRHFSRSSASENLDVTAEKFVKACEAVGLGQSSRLISDGASKARSGDLAGARADLDRAVELDARNAQAFFWRGYAEARAGEKGKAVGDLKRAIDLDPKDPFAYAELAGLYRQTGQLDEMTSTLTRLTEVAPDWQNGAAFVMRGSAYGQKGETARALADYAEACRRGNARACNVGQPNRP